MFTTAKRHTFKPPPISADRPRRPYPNGWFAVAFGHEVAPGRVLRRRFMGEDVVIYRTRQGALRVVKPYCPHLGAHLGYGGKVEGEELVCPFHGFRYDTDGTCVANLYGTRPPRVRLGHWTAREVNGAVVVWRHAAGVPPTWELPAIPSGRFPEPVRHTYTIIDHPQDVMENAIDIGHIVPVHGYQNPRLRIPIAVEGERLRVGTGAERVFPLVGNVDMLLDIEVDGLGYIWVIAKVPRFGAQALFQAWATPIDPCRVDLRFAVSLRVASGRRSRDGLALSRLLTVSLANRFWRDLSLDFPIWEHKRFVEHPKLAQGDGPIIQFRRWASQFYSGSGNGNPAAGGLPVDDLQVVD